MRIKQKTITGYLKICLNYNRNYDGIPYGQTL